MREVWLSDCFLLQPLELLRESATDLKTASWPALAVEINRNEAEAATHSYAVSMLCVAGWGWSMTGRATGVVTRLPWAASWHLWCRPLSTATTGPAAAVRSCADTSSRYRRMPGPGGQPGQETDPQASGHHRIPSRRTRSLIINIFTGWRDSERIIL